MAEHEPLPPPDLDERVRLCRHHLDLAVAHHGERFGVIALRRHLAGYFRGLRGAARLRAELAACRDPAELANRLAG